MAFEDKDLTDLARTTSAIGALKVIMDSLSFTGSGIPTAAHALLAELERQHEWLDNKRQAEFERHAREARVALDALVSQQAQDAGRPWTEVITEGPWF